MSAPEKIADVTLVLEGTYPYVLGGVSAWVEQIIKGLPEFTFALFFIGSKAPAEKKLLYTLPPNVISMTEVYLHDRLPPEEEAPGKLSDEERARVYEQLRAFYLAPTLAEKRALFWKTVDAVTALGDRFRFGNLLYDRESWEILRDAAYQFAPDESFIDFFWTVRFLHLPLWTLLKAASKIPAARLYHSPSAGYAGLVAALGARRRGAKYILTEHGIYTKERIAEISQADWIYEADRRDMDITQGLGKLKQLWVVFFFLLGQLSYDEAAEIITLYEGNVLTQIEFGAPPEKTAVIPNGIDPQKFNGIRAEVLGRWNPEPAQKIVGFIGRVVPIKDVKTLLRAARLVCERCPEVQFLIAGPYAEDPAYFDECQKIVKLLDIEEKVKFLGMQKLMEVLPKMDVMVLTSISEGLPLVVLEAMAASIPCVATDVGACRELIFGRVPEDKALGLGGRLTKILSPEETANALVTLLRDPELWRKTGNAGRVRAEKFYTMTSMLDAYRERYLRYGAKGGA